MSIMHFDAMTAASANIGLINLENMSADDFGTYGASAGIIFYSYGQCWKSEGGSDTFLFDWIDPNDAAPGNPVYQMKRSLGTGPDQPSGPSSEVWTNATAFLGFGWSVAGGGENYVTGDTIEWQGGTFETPVQATVTAVAGAITDLTFTHTGDYGILPTDPISATTLTGIGSGATFTGNSAFDHRCSWGLSAGYGDDEWWDGIISIRKGTGAILDTASIYISADAS